MGGTFLLNENMQDFWMVDKWLNISPWIRLHHPKAKHTLTLRWGKWYNVKFLFLYKEERRIFTMRLEWGRGCWAEISEKRGWPLCWHSPKSSVEVSACPHRERSDAFSISLYFILILCSPRWELMPHLILYALSTHSQSSLTSVGKRIRLS